MFSFRVEAADPHSRARLGRLTTPHGQVQTPAFMPVGTCGAVKGITPQQLVDTGAQIMLANTYHLHLRPGADAVARLGGLHRFMGWDKTILTDSGGYQVFSLAQLNEITDDGVVFRSHVDGNLVLTISNPWAQQITDLIWNWNVLKRPKNQGFYTNTEKISECCVSKGFQ